MGGKKWAGVGHAKGLGRGFSGICCFSGLYAAMIARGIVTRYRQLSNLGRLRLPLPGPVGRSYPGRVS